jgi:hypothetical protein
VESPPPRPAPLWDAGPRTNPADPDDHAEKAGAWVSGALWVVVLGAGLALAVYTLGAPFFPAGWLP